MVQKMLINARTPEEHRIAVVENDALEELYVERTSNDNYVGNIYKGVIVNIEQSIQAAFVDFGVGRNGFLHISDVEPHYFKQAPNFVPPKENDRGRFDRRRRNDDFVDYGRPRVKPPIQDVFQKGDEVVVQVIKEGIGTKGPTLSTYVSIPGRYLVLMPSLGRVGVSRKIEDDSVRRKLRVLMDELNPPKGLGFIVRTAGADRTRKELALDLAYLMRLWKSIARRIKNLPGPVGIYEESDMVIRTIRDVFASSVDEILVDDPETFERAKEFLQAMMPRYADRISLYEGREPLFAKYKVDSEIAKIHSRKVALKDGGSIVIDQAEALVAIDVNSGSFRANDSPEDTAFQMNLRAAKEIARQIRLRDLGGVIVNDFIDMTSEAHRRAVERTLRDAMKRDRAKTKILRTSPFGLIEMTRQRIRPGLKRSLYRECPCCKGNGAIKSVESMAIEVARLVALASQEPRADRIVVSVAEEIAEYMNNKKRLQLAQIEADSNVSVILRGVLNVWPEHIEIEVLDESGKKINFSKDGGLRDRER
ncbi:MAG: Rne/Rng family ribonuclease [Thermoguttaceae bacterium]|nr:Rne/Rng family ribonuclease [Thermoguttaceae bacterium]